MSEELLPASHASGLIFVDALIDYGWRHGRSSHLFVAPETDAELLHRFAGSIGLQRRWFQLGCSMPHYDVTSDLRLAALAIGAVEASRRETVAMIRRWRRWREETSKTR